MILAIETAGGSAASVALVDEGSAHQREVAREHGVAAELAPAILALLEGAGVAPATFAAVAVDCGPGSFTGMRIGIATARGLADGWGIPVWGVTHFDAFPRTPAGTARLLLIEAGYGRGVYYQLEHGGDVQRGFSSREDLEKIQAIADGNGIVLGWHEGVRLNEQHWQRAAAPVRIDAVAVGRAALRLKKDGRACAAEPVYLHTHAYAKNCSCEVVECEG